MFNFFKPDEAKIYRELLKVSVRKGGILTTYDIRKISNSDIIKSYLNRMSEQGVLTINVSDGANIEYMFPAVPRSYKPYKPVNLDEFFQALSEKGYHTEDGHVFLSEIIFAFDMELSDIIEALEMYCENEWITKNISKSGNVYFMFDKELMEKR